MGIVSIVAIRIYKITVVKGIATMLAIMKYGAYPPK